VRILGEAFSDAEKSASLAEARACIGIQWRHRGRQGLPWGHNVGLDCIGLAMRAVVAAGRHVRDLDAYGRDPDGTLIGHLDAHLGPQTAHLGPCSLLLFQFAKQPRHVALLSEVNTLIHCYDGGPRCVVEHAFDAQWRKRVVAGWAL
jgi:cell wall-associated NlpC family hydrolase